MSTTRDFLDEDTPVAECSACGRKTWEPGNVGLTCYMSQPDGSSCAGQFRPIPKGAYR